jgi:hypothetical protein
VYLDSVYQGTTPLTISSIAAGSYTILLELSGYADWSESVTVTSGNQTTVYEALTANTTTTATTITTLPLRTTTESIITAAITPEKTVSHKATTIKIPTPWPTDTPKASPVELAVILGGIGMGIAVLRRK